MMIASLAGGDVGEVGEPDLVRRLGGEFAAGGWARSDSRRGCLSCACAGAEPQDPAGRPGASAARSASARRGGRGRAARHAPEASRRSRCCRRGSGGSLRSARCWPLRAGSPAASATHSSRWPTTQDRAHHPNRQHRAMLIDEPELHREADPKMSAAFRMSRSIRSRSFSRRKRASSEARSDGDGAGACVAAPRRLGIPCRRYALATRNSILVGLEWRKSGPQCPPQSSERLDPQ